MKRSRPTTLLQRFHLLPVLAAALGLLGCHGTDSHSTEKGSASPPPPKVSSDSVTFPADSPQLAALQIEAVHPVAGSIARINGRLGWYEDATVRIFASVAGRVDKIHVQIGQQVEVGDILAMIASPDFGQAQADASRAAADVRLSERTLTRLRDLLEHGAVARKDVDAAENDAEAKHAEDERTRARLQLYGVTAGSIDGHYPLRTPVRGTVVDKTINPGQEVRPDQMLANAPQLFAPLFVVSDPKQLAVQLDITELEIGSLKPGQRLHVRSRAYPDKVFEGRLELVGDSLDPLTRIVKARGVVDNGEGLLRAEMYVSVEVDGNEETNAQPDASGQSRLLPGGSVEVPSGALFSLDNKHFAFVERSPGEFQRQTVVIGKEHDGITLVTQGLTTGQRIVSQGCLLLQSMTENAKD